MPEAIPQWITVLADDDLLFLKRFLLHSGSLKQLAEDYSVTYPTIRVRLNRLIEKVETAERPEAEDAFEGLLEMLVKEGVLVPGTARTMRLAHRRVISEATQRAERHGAANALQWRDSQDADG
ncbi:MAG: hypothetical protein AMXMBFR82_09990 [Candidatus Hydrogenedentota bacterium]